MNGVAVIGKLALTESALRREKLLNQNVQFALTEIVDPGKFPLMSAPGVLALKKLASRGRNNEDKNESLGHQVATVLRDLAKARRGAPGVASANVATR